MQIFSLSQAQPLMAAVAACCVLAMPQSSAAQGRFAGAGFKIDMLNYEVVVEPRQPMANPSHRQKLRAALTGGGHAVVCRHGATDWLAKDVQDGAGTAERDDRSRQRNLSPLGEAQAAAIRSALDHMGVKVGPVYASFFYRTREFAELATGQEPELKDELLGTKHPTIAPWWSIVSRSEGLPTTLFIAAHGQPAGAMKVGLGEGDCAIARLEGPKRLVVLAVLTPSNWRQLLVP